MKKTPKTTSNLTSSLNSDLPIIRKSINRPKEDKCDAIGTIHIVSEEEEMHVKMELEMEDETHEMLVKWGKEVASDEDYVRIAIDAGIREAVKGLDKEDTLPLV